MTKVLILGSKGNLGQQLVKVFSSGDEVIAWDRGEIDITDYELIIKKISDVKPKLVINAAAYNSVDKCETSDQEYDLAKKINIDGPKFLAEACLKISATLIHYSTNYVFAGEKKLGYKETDEPKPINRYGKSKFHGEKRILELSGRGLKWYLIRTSKLFGPGGTSEMAKPSFFDIMLEQSRNSAGISVVNADASAYAKTLAYKKAVAEKKAAPNQGPALKVVDGEVSCFTYTPDLAGATLDLVQTNRGFGIYHLTNSGACTWYQGAVELFKLAKIKVNVVPVSGDQLARPAKRPKYAVLLNTKLPPLRDYREALREYLGKM